MLHFRVKLILNFFLASHIFFITRNSFAQLNACNTDVTGKNVKWESSWAPDKKDGGLIYKIVRVTELRKEKVTMFELLGPESSFKKQRDLLIQSEAMMNDFCKKIDKSVVSKADNFNRDIQEEFQSELLKLPHIKYSKGSWQRADAPINEVLSACTILGKKFSCTSSDKQRYEQQLKELEDEVKLMDELGY